MEGFLCFLFFFSTRPHQLTSPIPWTATLVATMEIFHSANQSLISSLVLYTHSLIVDEWTCDLFIYLFYSLEGCSGTRAWRSPYGRSAGRAPATTGPAPTTTRSAPRSPGGWPAGSTSAASSGRASGGPTTRVAGPTSRRRWTGAGRPGGRASPTAPRSTVSVHAMQHTSHQSTFKINSHLQSARYNAVCHWSGVSSESSDPKSSASGI